MTAEPRSFTSLRRYLSPARSFVREARIWPDAMGRGRAGRRVITFPAKGPEDGAARLRIFEVARALEAQGWHMLVVPPALSLTQRQRLIRLFEPQAILMQGVRHPLNRPHLYPGLPVAMDMDDADFHLSHLADALVEAMPQTDLLIAGSRYVADWGRAAGAARGEVVWTGTPVSTRPLTDPATRPPVVAWAQTRPMTYVREAALVRRVMADVGQRHPGVTLRLYDRRPGDDPAFATGFQAPGVTVEWQEFARYRDYLGTFDDVAVGLAPLAFETPFSRGKSFGKVLAYLDRQVPVVASDAGEHGAFFTPETGLLRTDPVDWADATLSLLDDPELRRRQAAAAFTAFSDTLDIGAAAGRVGMALSGLISHDAVRSAG